jgi:hypothetical protein
VSKGLSVSGECEVIGVSRLKEWGECAKAVSIYVYSFFDDFAPFLSSYV